MLLETSQPGLVLDDCFSWMQAGQEDRGGGVLMDDAKRTFSTVTVLRPREHDSSLKPLPVMQVSPKKQ